jgi:HAD superfamily hydrolase (TIGR01490 family)
MQLALFDLDNTLLEGDSDHAWAEYLISQGLLDAGVYRARNDAFYEQYKAGTLNIHEYLRFALSTIAGRGADELAQLHAGYMHKRVRAMVREKGRALLAEHAGETRVIVTATNAFVTRPIADHLGVEHLIACEAEVRDGAYTGEPVGTPSFREGKVTRLHEWLAARGRQMSDYERVYFYSDSRNDLPLLEAVSHPVAVDPDAALAATAQARGWPIISLKDAA